MDANQASNFSQQQLLKLQVAHLTRDVVTLWQQFQDTGYEQLFSSLIFTLNSFSDQVKLLSNPDHRRLAHKIMAELKQLKSIYATLDKSLLDPIDGLIRKLEQESIKEFGEKNSLLPASGDIEKPIYISCRTPHLLTKLASHLVYLARRVALFNCHTELLEACAKEEPVAVVLIIDDKIAQSDLNIIKPLRESNKTLPVFLLSFTPYNDVEFRLEAMRHAYSGFFSGMSDESYFLANLERHVYNRPQNPYRVLIVDDSKAQALLLERMLQENEQFRVKTISEPYKVLDLISGFKPDVILLDMQMPECMGFELASVIRQSCRYTGTQILYMSAEEDADKRLKTLTEDADGFIVKPVKAKHLQKMLTCKALRGRNMMRQLSKDAYTSLDNKEYFIFAAEDQIQHASQQEQDLTFALLSIDHLRFINQHYGYTVGDQMLKGLVLFLRNYLSDVQLGRYGGNKISLMFTDCTTEQVQKILEKALIRFSTMVYHLDDEKLVVSFSGSIVAWEKGFAVPELFSLAAQQIGSNTKLGYARISVVKPNSRKL